MQVSSHIWLTILGFISLSVVISIVTHFWIRHHLKNKMAKPLPQAKTTVVNSTIDSNQPDNK